MAFEVAWWGMVTGCFMGSVLGGIWEVARHEQRVVSGILLRNSVLAYAGFSVFGFFLGYPDMVIDQEVLDQFRTIGSLEKVVVRTLDGTEHIIEDTEELARIAVGVQNSRLFYLSHEGTELIGKVVFYAKNQSQTHCPLLRPERQRNRILLGFPRDTEPTSYIELGQGAKKMKEYFDD